MPKRKSNPGLPPSSRPASLTCFDAALDLLASETFGRLDILSARFEAAAGIELNDGVIKHRWEEAVKRYWMMRSMDELCCAASRPVRSETSMHGEMKMEDDNGLRGQGQCPSERRDSGGRPLPPQSHPGVAVVHGFSEDEHMDWKRWTPRVGDVVLVELADKNCLWPGKIVDKRSFFQGRTIPRGNHFFAIRIYNKDISPTVTIKSRLIPLHFRPNPPLLASEALISAYHHAAEPTTFDSLASAREAHAAHTRCHPGVGDEPDRAKIRAEKDTWNQLVNWVMSERRIEKLRAVGEERERQLRDLAKVEEMSEGMNQGVEMDDISSKKRRMSATVPLPPTDSPGLERASWIRPNSPAHSIFGPSAAPSCFTPRRIGSPSVVGFIRPALSTPQRSMSPRRLPERKRSGIYTGVGEFSPRGRGGTYTPPRILPSGDETAPRGTGSPAPSLPKFDFVSPLGPVKLGKLSNGNGKSGTPTIVRKGSLEAVKEEPVDEEGEQWTLVQSKRGRRAGSAPCPEKAKEMDQGKVREDGMDVEDP